MRKLPVLALAALLALAACSHSAPAPKAAAAPVPAVAAPAPSAAASSAAAAAAPAEHAVSRAAVDAVVSDGLGAFLQRIAFDDRPVLVGGRFHGFRIARLRDDAPWSGFWAGVDLKPGDVVTSVNGFPIEHPDQAQVAFESLEVASELRVSYDRAGQSRELVYAIVDR